nr:TMEM165/GDT1 family protein [Marinobacterium sp. xm-d-420]
MVSTFSLVSLAEIGDKSLLVCMALATRYRHWQVFWGAAIAFLVLNLLAVIFGSTIAALVPESIILATVAVMFIVFGVLALRATEDEEDIELEEKASHGIFITTFLMILVSEFGDKTQIAVAALSTTMDALSVWIGGSLGLMSYGHFWCTGR